MNSKSECLQLDYYYSRAFWVYLLFYFLHTQQKVSLHNTGENIVILKHVDKVEMLMCKHEHLCKHITATKSRPYVIRTPMSGVTNFGIKAAVIVNIYFVFKCTFWISKLTKRDSRSLYSEIQSLLKVFDQITFLTTRL